MHTLLHLKKEAKEIKCILLPRKKTRLSKLRGYKRLFRNLRFVKEIMCYRVTLLCIVLFNIFKLP